MTRYAIYFAPERDTRLWAFGCKVLGRDPETGEAVAPFVPDGVDAEEWAGLTASARRYGFHATLKAPFALAEGRSADGLMTALSRFAGEQSAIRAPAPALTLHDNYAALTLAQPDPRVQALAASAVSTFDDFRAPLSQAERQRRLAGGLQNAHRQNLERWGYPYVFNLFTFHMTLAGPLPAERAEAVRTALAAAYEHDVGDEPLRISSLALFVEPQAGAPFTLAQRASLGGAA